MTLLLSGDEYCCCLEKKFFVSQTGYVLIQRYLNAFEKVYVAFRTKIVDAQSELGKYSYSLDSSKVEFITIPFFQGPRQFVPKYRKIKHAIKNTIDKCDFAILRLPSTTAFVAMEVIWKKKLPYATEIVFDCYDAVETSDDILSKLIWRILHKMQVKACRNALGVSCVTEKYLQRRYFPIRPEAISSHYSSIELPEDFYFSPRQYPGKKVFKIIHIANQVQFNGRKGHNELIKVVSEINRADKRVEVVFVGENYFNGQERLKDLAQSLGTADSVTFTGFLNRQLLRNELINADIAVLPTRAEGLPRVVIEAMAMGLPCITSPVSGNPELIDENFLVRYDDVNGMVERCKILIANKDIYERQSRGNFEKSREYSSDVLNPRRTGFYNDLIAIVKSKKLREQ